MRNREDLSAILKEALGCDHVYFQPPSNVCMRYPAIVYNLSDIDNRHADNLPYLQYHRYDVTVIDEDPDSKVADRVSKISGCRFERSFTMDNLNHYVFSLYY